MIFYIKPVHPVKCYPCNGRGQTFEKEMLIKPGPNYATNPEDNTATGVHIIRSICHICRGKGYTEVRYGNF